MKQERLVLGSAGKRAEGATTLDINPEHNPDVIHDLNKTPLPFEDNQFREIICHHVLNHVHRLQIHYHLDIFVNLLTHCIFPEQNRSWPPLR